MTDTIELDRIHVHPNNPRRKAVADDDMVTSIRSVGIAQALTVMPYAGDCPLHDECFTLAGGHRRLDGARQAGLAEVPVMVRDDLVTEAQQLEFMLVENLHRLDLTPVEQADTYVQLELLGMDDKAIAAAVGQSTKTVKARKRLTSLSEKASDKLHGGQITIGDAEALLEFSDQPEVLAELEEALGTNDYTWKVNNARETVKRAARNAEIIAGFKNLGAVETDPTADGVCTLGRFRHPDLQDPAGHTHCECLGYVDHGPASYAEPRLVCLDGPSHDEQEAEFRATPTTGADSKEQAEKERDWERERERLREETAAATAAAQAAENTRVDWIATHWLACLPTKGKQHTQLVAAARAVLPSVIATGVLDDCLAGTALARAGGREPVASWHERTKEDREYAKELALAPASDILKAFAALLTAITEDALSYAAHGGHQGFDDEDVHLANTWAWFEGSGYPLSSADAALRDSVLRSDEDGDD